MLNFFLYIYLFFFLLGTFLQSNWSLEGNRGPNFKPNKLQAGKTAVNGVSNDEVEMV